MVFEEYRATDEEFAEIRKYFNDVNEYAKMVESVQMLAFAVVPINCLVNIVLLYLWIF